MIETNRLILRPYELQDLEPYVRMAQDPQLDFPGRQAISREDAWQKLLRYVGHWTLLGYGNFAIIEKRSGEYIGETGLWDAHRGLGEDFDGFDEAGWFLVFAKHGNGFAYEAASAVHDWYGRTTGNTRTVCMISPENSVSVGLSEKLGYRAFREANYKGDQVVLFERQ